MSLVWPAKEADVVLDQPRLHAFVVAVGDYPHLFGGKGPLAKDPFGLSQVTTPRHTGRRIAEWLLASHANPACPLGSLEVLLSPKADVATPDGPKQAEPATMANIEAAFLRWLKRCGSRPDNTALLYLCGHGMAKSSRLFLPEDFGDPALPDPWERCIDFDMLRVGMRACAARTQLFFYDACRETPFGLLTQINPRGKPLVSATFNDPPVPCSAAYCAAPDGLKAYGPDDDATFFGQAVMSCLDGVAALQKGGKLVVDTYSLGNALGQTMAQFGRRHGLTLGCAPDPGGMAHLHEPKTARVVAAFTCRTPEANAVADFTLTGPRVVKRPVGSPRPVGEILEAGQWQVELAFPQGQFPAPPPVTFDCAPPVVDEVITP
jgi:hypothetical protein